MDADTVQTISRLRFRMQSLESANRELYRMAEELLLRAKMQPGERERYLEKLTLLKDPEAWDKYLKFGSNPF